MIRANGHWFVSWTKGVQRCGREFDLNEQPNSRANRGIRESLDIPANKEDMPALRMKFSKMSMGFSTELSKSLFILEWKVVVL